MYTISLIYTDSFLEYRINISTEDVFNKMG